MAPIEKAAVVGAGVMGAGIAAHLANAGLSVVLLDVAEDGPRRSRRAEDAVERQRATGGFMGPALAGSIRPGNVEDDLALLADADWIIEAVAERIEIKRTLFARLDAVRKNDSIVSSNTSTLPVSALTEGQSRGFAGDFMVAHFFNPPRHMRLLELVAGPATRPDAVARIRHFADVALGKGVVECKDRPGFIGNRIGCFWIAVAISEAIALGLRVEEADAVIGRPFGIPSTGVFALLDLIGVDLMPQIWDSLSHTLAAADPMRSYDLNPPLIHSMIARGLIGRKAGAGFFRSTARDGVKRREAIDLATGEYRNLQPAALASLDEAGKDPRALISHPDRGGRYAWRVMGSTLAYAASLVPEITDQPDAVDAAMRLGYGWARGPFELMDVLGPAWFAQRLETEGEEVPGLLREAAKEGSFYRTAGSQRQCLQVPGGYRPVLCAAGVLSLATLKLTGKPIAANRAGSLWDLGDGVACLEFHTKANAFDHDLVAAVETATIETGRAFRALVLGSDVPMFSAGANLAELLEAIRAADWSAIEAFVRRGQRAFRNLKFAEFPVVAAVCGIAFGGGCEVALHCDAIQAHAELTMGLVETKVGLIPGWGGCKELLLRLASAQAAHPDGGVDVSAEAFRTIAGARTSGSALQARDLYYLRPGDGITMNRDRVLADAKRVALRLTDNYRPPEPAMLRLPGRAAQPMLLETELSCARPLDRTIAQHLANVLTGGEAEPAQPVTEDRLYDLEREAFLALVRREETAAFIEPVLGGKSRN